MNKSLKFDILWIEAVGMFIEETIVSVFITVFNNFRLLRLFDLVAAPDWISATVIYCTK